MRGDLEVRTLDDDRQTDWRSFVESSEPSTVFHSIPWLTSVESVFGYDPEHALVYEGGELISVVPGFATGMLGGKTIVNPFSEYGFPLVAEHIGGSRVLSRLAADVGTLDARVVKDVEWSGVHGYNEAGYGAVRTGVSPRLWLDRSYDELWNESFQKQIRTRVRTAEESGMIVREGSLDEFYPLYLQTMRRLGSPPFPPEFFETLEDEFDDVVTPMVAYLSDEPVGGILLLEWNDQTMMWGNGSKKEYWEYRPNQLLYARCIERACEQSQRVIDFGRSRPDTGVHEFKTQFGGVDCALTSFVAPPHRTGRASLEQYSGLEPVARRLGPLIAHPSIGPKLKEIIHE